MNSILQHLKKLIQHRFFSLALNPFLVCVGVWMTFGNYFRSHFDLISGDNGDNRFNTLLMENTFQQLSHGQSIFQLNMFYPFQNAIGLSDTLIGISPIFCLLRVLGSPIFQAFEWTLILISVLNFFSFRFAIKSIFKIQESPMNSMILGLTSFLFAFNLSKTSHIFHAQLFPHFYPILALYGLYRFFQEPARIRWYALFIFSLGLQFYTAFYFFWFTLVSILFLVLILAIRPERKKLISPIRSVFTAKGLLVTALWVAFVAPLLLHYVGAFSEVGPRHYESVREMIPRLRSWVLVPPWHRWNRWIRFYPQVETLPIVIEHWVSPGLFTMILGVLTFGIRRKKISGLSQLLFGIIFCWFLFCTYIPEWNFSLWQYTGWLIPGGKAVRALSRVGIYLSLFWSVLFLEGLFWIREEQNKKIRVALVLLVLLCLREQSAENPSYFSSSREKIRIDRIESITPKNCSSVLYTYKDLDPALKLAPVYNILDGVRAAFELNLHSVNGYSGGEPKGYDLLPNQAAYFEKQGSKPTESDCVVEVISATNADI